MTRGTTEVHREPVPLAGGCAGGPGQSLPMAVAALVVWARGWDSATLHPWAYGMGRRAGQTGGVADGGGGSGGVGLAGIIGMSCARGTGFAGQVLIAGGRQAGGTRITLFVPNALFSYGVTVLWLVTLMNACNFLESNSERPLRWHWCNRGLLVRAQGGGGGAVCWWRGLPFLGAGASAGLPALQFPKGDGVPGGYGGSHLVGYLLGVLAVLPAFLFGGASGAFGPC